MAPHEDSAGELLWKYIEELKRAESGETLNFVARTSADPTEMAGLLPAADAVQDLAQAGALMSAAQIETRARLAALIRASGNRAPSPLARLGLENLWPRRARQAALAACLLLLTLASAYGYFQWQLNQAVAPLLPAAANPGKKCGAGQKREPVAIPAVAPAPPPAAAPTTSANCGSCHDAQFLEKRKSHPFSQSFLPQKRS